MGTGSEMKAVLQCMGQAGTGEGQLLAGGPLHVGGDAILQNSKIRVEISCSN